MKVSLSYMCTINAMETRKLNLLRRKNVFRIRSKLAHAEIKVYSLTKGTRVGNSAQHIVSCSTAREFKTTIFTSKLKVFPKKIFVSRSERHKFFLTVHFSFPGTVVEG